MKTLLEIIAERLPELEFKEVNGKLMRASMKNMEATEGLFAGQIYRIIVEEVNE